LALSRSGLPGDGSNLQRFIGLRSAPLYGTTHGTVEERLATVIALTGLETQFSRGEVEQLQAIGARLAEDRDSISGVDPNEETLSLMRFQQSFQAASRF